MTRLLPPQPYLDASAMSIEDIDKWNRTHGTSPKLCYCTRPAYKQDNCGYVCQECEVVIAHAIAALDKWIIRHRQELRVEAGLTTRTDRSEYHRQYYRQHYVRIKAYQRHYMRGRVNGFGTYSLTNTFRTNTAVNINNNP